MNLQPGPQTIGAWRLLAYRHGEFLAPGGIAEGVANFVAPAARVPNVTAHVHPLVKGDAHRIMGINVRGQPEAGCVFWIFGLEGAEKFVPDNQRAGMVAIDVLGIGTVMNAMMRGRVQNSFERTHGPDQFGVNPELVEKADRPDRHN